MREVKMKVLFVCGKNQWRSPTGEAIYRDDQRMAVRSAGLSQVAKRKLSVRDLEWADLVFVMDAEQKRKIMELYQRLVDLPEIVNLDIPDIYPFMDAELIDLLRGGVETGLADWDSFCDL